MLKYIKSSTIICCLFLIACDTTNNKPLQIKFSVDSTKIVILGVNTTNLYEIKKALDSNTVDPRLVLVTQISSDKDSLTKEIDFPGSLFLFGDSILFIPKQAFVKGESYRVATLINTQFAAPLEIAKGDVGHQIKTQQQVLKKE